MYGSDSIIIHIRKSKTYIKHDDFWQIDFLQAKNLIISSLCKQLQYAFIAKSPLRIDRR